MHADAAYAIGRGHRVCEDYAVAGVGARGPFALVSDGCSSSPDTDFGARLLAAAAAADLRRGELCTARALGAATAAADAVELSRHALDATLLAVHHDADQVRATVTGDGVVAAIGRDGVVETWCIRHPTGAPAYLSYHLDPRRLHAYLAAHAARSVDIHLAGDHVRTRELSLRHDPYVWHLSLPANAYRVVAVLSDGATSFECVDGPVPLAAVLDRLLDFKVMRGAFVQRRLRKFLRRECPARGWHHDDDLAIAAVALQGSA